MTICISKKELRENQNCLREEIYFSVKQSSKKCDKSVLIGIKNDKGQSYICN